jgi:hypothetical protein
MAALPQPPVKSITVGDSREAGFNMNVNVSMSA